MTNLDDKIATYSKTGDGTTEPKFRSAYSKKPRQRIGFTGLGRTKQSHKAECDINNILARFKRTGVLEFTNKNQPQYGDVTGLEYQEAMLLCAKAQGMFAELPAHVRDRFDNDPAQFLEFVNDDKNEAEARKMGLLKAQEPRKTEKPSGTTPPVDKSKGEPVASPVAPPGVEKTSEKPKT